MANINHYTGGKKGGRGKGGGGGRGVRGVDFGLGIGYNPESTSTSQTAAPSRSAAVNSLRTGMMAQFRSNFVAASSNSQNDIRPSRPLLPGFVSGGSIGGEAYKAPQPNPTSAASALSSAGNIVQNGSQRKAER